MSRRHRISYPPPSHNPALNTWLHQLTDAINTLPDISVISTLNGPNSAVTAQPGALAIDIGSSNTTFWAKQSGTSSLGWAAIGFA